MATEMCVFPISILLLLSSNTLGYGFIALGVGVAIGCLPAVVSKSHSHKTSGLLLVIAGTLIPHTCAAQTGNANVGFDPVKVYSWEESFPRFGLEHIGRLSLFFYAERQYRTPLAFLQLLQDSNVIKALEISQAQRREIDVAVVKLNRAIGDYDERLNTKHDMTPDRERQIFERPVFEGVQAAQEVLLAHQSDRLNQILLQYQIARVGLCGAWYEGELGKLVPLSPEDRKKLLQRYVELYSEHEPELQGLRDELMNECWEVLSPEQQKDLETRVSPREKIIGQMLCIWLVLNDDELAEQFETKWRGLLSDVDVRWKPYTSIISNPMLKLRLDAKLVSIFPMETYTTIEGGVHSEILELFRREAIRDGLELSDDQVSAFDAMMREHSDLNTLKRQDWNENGNFLGYFAFTAKWQETFKRQNKKEYDVIHSVLLPGQVQEFQSVVLRSAVNRTGLLFSLLHGPLRDELSLNSEQLESLYKLRRRWSEKIRSKLIQMENTLNEKLLAEMDIESVAKYRELIGDDLGLNRGNVELFIHLIREMAAESSGVFGSLVREGRGLLPLGLSQK